MMINYKTYQPLINYLMHQKQQKYISIMFWYQFNDKNKNLSIMNYILHRKV